MNKEEKDKCSNCPYNSISYLCGSWCNEDY